VTATTTVLSVKYSTEHFKCFGLFVNDVMVAGMSPNDRK
jgi:hypothetical protein